MKSNELIWAMLPTGLQDFFELEDFEKTDKLFKITLVERNTISDLPDKYKSRKVLDTSLNSITIDDFPIRGRKGGIILKRRYWKFERVTEWYRRELKLCADNTKIAKEFASFLKELNRKFPGSDFLDRYVQ